MKKASATQHALITAGVQEFRETMGPHLDFLEIVDADSCSQW